ncbi:MAG: YicC family protein [Alphaproteobacteria bacterium]|nr:YicC family protein [Alphaproteobacteria bacterium]
MTGFARHSGHLGAARWIWELKSVNGRSLELRFRLPPGLDHLETAARAALAKHLRRGNVTVQLALERAEAGQRVVVNELVLDQLLAVQARYARRVDAAPLRLDALLAVRGVVDVVETAPDASEEIERRDAAILTSLDETATELTQTRAREGARLAAVIETLLSEIAALCDAAARTAAARPEAIKARLKMQLVELLDASRALPEDRLVQEVALLATKADIREELDRLDAHISAARELIAKDGAVGRPLDFLCQEFNREANTLCSKSGDVELTAIGLKLKASVEQLREQIQNIE